jgi:hypothetical protein
MNEYCESKENWRKRQHIPQALGEGHVIESDYDCKQNSCLGLCAEEGAHKKHHLRPICPSIAAMQYVPSKHANEDHSYEVNSEGTTLDKKASDAVRWTVCSSKVNAREKRSPGNDAKHAANYSGVYIALAE